MLKKTLFLLFVVVALQCALSQDATAQTNNNPCINWVGNGCNVLGMPCPGWFNCQVEGPWLTVCQVMNPLCAPYVPCPNCPSSVSPAAGSPVSLTNGNTFIKQTDVSLPGLSGGLRLVRTWNSAWPSSQSTFQVGLFGPNWRSTFEERVFVDNDHYIKYARGDGSFWAFGSNGSTYSTAAPANVTVTYGSTYWTLTFQSGEQRLFDVNSGNLVSIVDRNGNTTQVSYDGTARLTTVTDPASRHLYFGYGSGTSRLVTSVTSDFGISLSYSYDGQGRLSQVTYPDLTTISFTYNSQSLITAVTDSNGKTLESHTYDSNNRGLTSSQAGGVQAVTASYPNQ